MPNALKKLPDPHGIEFELKKNENSVWITVGKVSVNIRRFGDHGAMVKLYRVGEELLDPKDQSEYDGEDEPQLDGVE